MSTFSSTLSTSSKGGLITNGSANGKGVPYKQYSLVGLAIFALGLLATAIFNSTVRVVDLAELDRRTKQLQAGQERILRRLDQALKEKRLEEIVRRLMAEQRLADQPPQNNP